MSKEGVLEQCQAGHSRTHQVRHYAGVVHV